MHPRPLRPLPLLVIGASMLAGGCGGSSSIDHTKAEDLVRKAVAAAPGAQQPTAIHCPSGVAAKTGATLTCDIVYADGTRGTVTEHVLDSSGHARIEPADLHLQTAGSAAGGTSTTK